MIIEAKSIEKSFGPTRALRGATISATKGEIAVEPLDGETHWHGKEMREILEQPMAIWYGFGDVDVFLGADDKPVGFLDKTRIPNCVYKLLPHSEILSIAAATGFVSPQGRVLSTAKGPGDSLEATVINDASKVDSPRLVVRINASLGRVISVVPEGVVP